MSSVLIQTTFLTHTCPREGCGVEFAIPKGYDARRREDHRKFYCPSGHAMSFTGKTEAEKQRERADRLARQVEAREEDIRTEQRRLESERRAHATTKGKLTRAKKRAVLSVCPGCNRHFANVESHIANKHPELLQETKA